MNHLQTLNFFITKNTTRGKIIEEITRVLFLETQQQFTNKERIEISKKWNMSIFSTQITVYFKTKLHQALLDVLYQHDNYVDISQIGKAVKNLMDK